MVMMEMLFALIHHLDQGRQAVLMMNCPAFLSSTKHLGLADTCLTVMPSAEYTVKTLDRLMFFLTQ